jgi:hypothetical protein
MLRMEGRNNGKEGRKEGKEVKEVTTESEGC